MIINHKEVPVIHDTNIFKKYAYLRVNSYGQLVISGYPLEKLEEEQFIRKNISSIQKQLDLLKVTFLPTFKNGTFVWILGKKYIVYRSKRIQTVFKSKNGIVFPRSYTVTDIRFYLEHWLESVISVIYHHFIKKYNFEYISFYITAVYSFWGRCHRSRKSHFKDYIKFNLALIFVPIRLVEYVVVHELCHLKHMNHSKAFWDEVERILPDAKKKRKQLNFYNLEWLLERLDIKKREY